MASPAHHRLASIQPHHWDHQNNKLMRRMQQAEENPFIKSGRWYHLSIKENEQLVLKLNLLTLWERKGGERYWVDENGLLKIYEGFSGTVSWYVDKVKRLFTKRDDPDRTDNKVKAVISNILTQLGGAKFNDINSDVLKVFFTEKMKGLREKVYDRSKIPPNIVNMIKTEGLKVAEAKRAPPVRMIEIEEDPPPPPRTREQELNDYCTSIDEYRLRVEEVKFAQSLGVDLIKNEHGTSGNYIGRDWMGRKRLIFKPDDEGPDSSMNPHFISRLKTLFWSNIPFFARRTCYYPDQNHVNEVASSLMARELGLSVVPLTEMETFKSTIFNSGTHEVEKRGSCQIWVEANRELGERIEEAYQAFELFNPKWLPIQIPLFIQTWLMNQKWLELYATPIWNLFNLTKKRELIFNALPKEFFDLLAIVHILTGNGDGHPANYLLLRKEDEIGQKTIKIFLIDFGWSMPHAHASDALALRFLYDFRYLPQANYSFDAAGQETIRRISNRAQEIICEVGKFINQHQTVKANQIDSLEVENNRSAVDYTKQMKMMQERLQPLLWGIENNIPINKIAEVRSPDDYIRFFADRMNEGNGKFVPNWRREEVDAFLAKQQR